MSIHSIKEKTLSLIINLLGWHTNRKIVVIESDDWGMIRMSSPEAYDFFQSKGLDVKKCSYNSNDHIERSLDMEGLFDVLDSVRDKNGQPAIITANNIVANPNFKKIQKDNYTHYYHESFLDTLKKNTNTNRVFDAYLEGREKKLFHPQLHGREHLNVKRWLEALKKNDTLAHLAFQKNMFSVHAKGDKSSCRKEYLDAFGNPSTNISLRQYAQIIREATELFKDIHGFYSKSFIAPCYTWPIEIEPILKQLGVSYLQGVRVQRIPVNVNNDVKIKKKYHYIGQKNEFKQTFLVRNAFFEPSSNPNKNWVDSTLRSINQAFNLKKPAIISSHRVNFMGGLNPKNRDNGLQQLKLLLNTIVKNWKDVEFMTSDQLGDLINVN